MSNTPRTDAMLTLLGLLGEVGSTSRFAEHARNLELELNEVEQQCDELAEALKEVADTLEVLCEGERDDPDSGIYGWDDINKRIIPLARAALAKYRQPQEEALELFPGTLDALRDLGKQEAPPSPAEPRGGE